MHLNVCLLISVAHSFKLTVEYSQYKNSGDVFNDRGQEYENSGDVYKKDGVQEIVAYRGPGMVVYHDYDQYFDNIEKLFENKRNECNIDAYSINIVMSGDFCSGTDGDVEVRLYSRAEQVTVWSKLDTPWHNDFERLSSGIYCMDSAIHNHLHPTRIGIRKNGSDRMKIYLLQIERGREIFIAEEIEEWITTDNHEYIFDLTRYDFF